MTEALDLAAAGMRQGLGGPFGAVVARGDEIVGRGFNQVISTLDPTAHAEIMALRDACQTLGTFHLDGCEIYASCEPCPMCLGAIYWARIGTIHFAATREDAAQAGFIDASIYEDLARPIGERRVRTVPMARESALGLFEEWKGKADRVAY